MISNLPTALELAECCLYCPEGRALCASLMTGELLEEARGWIADCGWSDRDEDSEPLTDAQVIDGIARHYSGGLPEFIAHNS